MVFKRLLAISLTLYFTTYLSWPDWLYFYSFFSLKNVDAYDHYAACCVPLRAMGGKGALVTGDKTIIFLNSTCDVEITHQ